MCTNKYGSMHLDGSDNWHHLKPNLQTNQNKPDKQTNKTIFSLQIGLPVWNASGKRFNVATPI